MSDLPSPTSAVDLIVALREAGDALLHTSSLEALLDAVLPQLERLVPSETANVMLLSEGTLCVVRRRGYERYGLDALISGLCLSPDEPPFAQMQEACKPLVLSEATGEAWVYPPAELGAKTYLGAPLFAGDELVGFLNLESPREGAFPPESVELLQTFAHLVGAAIRNALYRRESERRQHELEQMNRITSGLNRLLYIEAILESGLDAALTITGMERGAVFIFDPQRDELVMRVQRNMEEQAIELLHRIPPDYGVSGRAFSEQRIVLAKDLGDYHPQDAPILRLIRGTTVAVPLIVGGESLGVMTLNVGERDYPISKDTLSTAQAIADQLAFAVQRGQLVNQLQTQLQSVRHLYEASSAFLAQTNRREVLFILLRALKEIVPHTVGVACYHFTDNRWVREMLYPMSFADRCASPMACAGERVKSYISREEIRLLDACREGKVLVLIDREHNPNLAGWGHIGACGVSQVIFLPVVIPQRGRSLALDVIALLRDVTTPLDPQTQALVWALLHQVGATLSRVHYYELIRAEQSRLRAILEASKDGIILVDRKARIRYINGLALRLCGLEEDVSIWERQPWSSFLEALRRVGNAALYDRFRTVQSHGEGEEETSETADVRTKGGRTVNIGSWQVEDRRGERGRLFVIEDVTERREVERLREELLHMLVHDLRNPLTLVINALQIQMSPELKELRVEALELGYANAVRLLSMINAILDLTRLRSGYLQVHPQLTELESIIRGQLDYLIPPGREVRVSLEIEEDARFVCADLPLLRRVFQNILGNALKFISYDESGYIRVEIHRQGDWVQLSVFNNGEPISEDVMPRLFQQYATGDAYVGGIGLGLAFCKMVVEAHGGRIWAENLPDRGEVVFSFTLPVADASCGPMPGGAR